MSSNLCVQSKNNRDGSKSNSSVTKLRLADASWRSGGVEKDESELGEEGVRPKHIAITIDGNRRWATNRGLAVQHGHRAGKKATKQLILNCMEFGVQVLSLFNFSTENWIRHEDEVDQIMSLVEEFAATDVHEFITKNDMRVNFIGNRRRLPLSFQEVIHKAEESSKGNKGMHLVLATSYSGRYDITEATKKIATKVQQGDIIQVEDIDDALIEQHLETNIIDHFPNPDLLIRTSGELRISNYMLWQLAYTELFFCDKLYPDFDKEDLLRAIAAFQNRHRRFGGVQYRTPSIPLEYI